MNHVDCDNDNGNDASSKLQQRGGNSITSRRRGTHTRTRTRLFLDLLVVVCGMASLGGFHLGQWLRRGDNNNNTGTTLHVSLSELPERLQQIVHGKDHRHMHQQRWSSQLDFFKNTGTIHKHNENNNNNKLWWHSALLAHPNIETMVLLMDHPTSSTTSITTMTTSLIEDLAIHKNLTRVLVVFLDNDDLSLPSSSSSDPTWNLSDKLFDTSNNTTGTTGISIEYGRQSQMMETSAMADQLLQVPIHAIVVDPNWNLQHAMTTSTTTKYLTETVLPFWSMTLCRQKILHANNIGDDNKNSNINDDTHGILLLNMGQTPLHSNQSPGWMVQRRLTFVQALQTQTCLSTYHNTTTKSTTSNASDDDDSDGNTIHAQTPAIETVTEFTTTTHDHVLVGFSDSATEAYWHQTEAEWNLRLYQQLQPEDVLEADTNNHGILLDSTWMSRFEYPTKFAERDFCLLHPEVPNCHMGGSGLDPNIPNTPLDLLEVQQSQQGNHSGRGVFATTLIPAGTHIAIEEHAHAVFSSWTSTKLISEFVESSTNSTHYQEYWHDVLHEYLDGYGFLGQTWGKLDYYVDSSLVTFSNHGCNGDFNIGTFSPWHEGNLEIPPNFVDDVPSDDDDDNSSGKPDRLPHALRQDLWNRIPIEYQERRGHSYYPIRRIFNKTAVITSHEIPIGGEILDNYMEYGGEVDGSSFWQNVVLVGRECGGQAGSIEQYQNYDPKTAASTKVNDTITQPDTTQEEDANANANIEL